MRYFEVVSAGALKRKKYEATAENSGTYVITVDTQTKQALIDGNEFETDVELNDLEFVNAIKQKSNLKGWRIAIEVNNGTTILVGKIIGVIQQEVGGIARTICSCLMSNGAYLTLSVEKEGETLSATLNGNVIGGGGGGNIVAFSNVAFDQDDTATLQVSSEQFDILKGEDNVVIVLELASGDVVTLYRTKHDSDLVSFGSVYGTTNGTDKKGHVYFANFSNSGSSIIGKAYEMEMGAGLTATVDETNKTINIVLG